MAQSNIDIIINARQTASRFLTMFKGMNSFKSRLEGLRPTFSKSRALAEAPLLPVLHIVLKAWFLRLLRLKGQACWMPFWINRRIVGVTVDAKRACGISFKSISFEDDAIFGAEKLNAYVHRCWKRRSSSGLFRSFWYVFQALGQRFEIFNRKLRKGLEQSAWRNNHWVVSVLGTDAQKEMIKKWLKVATPWACVKIIPLPSYTQEFKRRVKAHPFEMMLKKSVDEPANQ